MITSVMSIAISSLRAKRSNPAGLPRRYAPRNDDQPIISPASAALIKLASEPASSARRPSLAIIGRWLGARLPVTAIWIAIELKLAKPHRAKVTIARLRSLSAAAGPAALPRSMKATNSFRTILVPNRPPATPASLHGMPIRNMTGEKSVPTIAWNDRSG